MILRDADTGKIIWQENKDLSSCEEEHKAKIPVKILDLRAVSREINFSTVERIQKFHLDQKVSTINIFNIIKYDSHANVKQKIFLHRIPIRSNSKTEFWKNGNLKWAQFFQIQQIRGNQQLKLHLNRK